MLRDVFDALFVSIFGEDWSVEKEWSVEEKEREECLLQMDYDELRRTWIAFHAFYKNAKKEQAWSQLMIDHWKVSHNPSKEIIDQTK